MVRSDQLIFSWLVSNDRQILHYKIWLVVLKKFIFSCVIWSCTYFHRWTLKISLFNTLKAWRLYPLDDIVKSLAAEYWHKLYKMWYDFFQYWCFWLLCNTKHACRFDYRLTFNNKTCQWYISSMIYFLPINVYRKEI